MALYRCNRLMYACLASEKAYAGAHFGVDPKGSQCAQLMDGGSVSLSVSVAVPANSPPFDPCAEALQIAQMIEPRLPKAAK